MFSISEVKRCFYDAATGLTTNHSGPRYTGISKYDLPNSNIYNLEAELLEVADQVTYNTEYLLYLFHAHILEVRNFLDHHFGSTPDRAAFLDYNEYGIMTDTHLSEGKRKLISAWIAEQRQNCEPNNKYNLQSIFNDTNNSFNVCLELLEDLELTIDGIANTTSGRVGKLTGLITAIRRTPGMLKLDNPTEKLLLLYFNSFLNTTYKTFSKRNEDYLPSIDTAQRYIKINFKK